MADVLNLFFDQTMPNQLGGSDFYVGGMKVAYSVDNALGGEDLYNPAGHRLGTTRANAFGGVDAFDDAGHRMGSTVPTTDGVALHDADGQRLGVQHSDAQGVTFRSMNGSFVEFRRNVFGGLQADPLQNLGRVQFPSLLG